MRSDEHSDLWSACHELAVLVYRVTAAWPAAEVWGLAGQARRAAFMAALSAVDDPPGVDIELRRRRTEQVVALLDRLRYALLLAHELGYIATAEWETIGPLERRAEELARAQLTLTNELLRPI